MTTIVDQRSASEFESTAVPAAHDDEPALTVIRHRPGWRSLDVRELWQARELIYFLAWRDVKVRYKQTALGAIWAILQPLLMAAVFTIILGRIAGVSSGGVPYPLFAFSGFLVWTFFSRSLTAAAGSLLQSQALLTKVYFPRLAVPMASVGAPLVDLLVTFPVLWILMAYYGWPWGAGMLVAPIVVLLTLLAALGVGTLLAALSVAYRDFKHVVPFLVQIWMFATPAIYMETQAPQPRQAATEMSSTDPSADPTTGETQKSADAPAGGRLGRLFEWNPVTGLVRSLRAACLNQPIDSQGLAYSATFSVVAFFAGCYYFRRVERQFADII